MKKLYLSMALAAMACAGVSAADFPWLRLTLVNGAEHYLSVSGLDMKVSGGQLVCSNPQEEISFDLTSLSTMQFTSEENSVSAIGADREGEVTLYTLEGTLLGSFSSLEEARHSVSRAGLYLIKADGQTVKMLIK